jgi:hypothetical protein
VADDDGAPIDSPARGASPTTTHGSIDQTRRCPGRARVCRSRPESTCLIGKAAVAIPALILLVDGVLRPTSLGLAEHGVPHPNTIGYAAGAAVLVIAGPLLNRYFGRLMLTNARQHITAAPGPGSP